MSKATLPLIVEFLEILLRYLIGFLLDALWLPLFLLPTLLDCSFGNLVTLPTHHS